MTSRLGSQSTPAVKTPLQNGLVVATSCNILRTTPWTDLKLIFRDFSISGNLARLFDTPRQFYHYIFMYNRTAVRLVLLYLKTIFIMVSQHESSSNNDNVSLVYTHAAIGIRHVQNNLDSTGRTVPSP